jgi:hypothetical protein
MRSLKYWAGAAALSVLVSVAAWAADAGGKWSWTQRRQNNDVQMTLEVKQDGEKLTGTVSTPNGQKVEIKEGSVKGNEVSFVVVREFNGQQFKTTYKGKLEGDTITGNAISVRDGQERSREWKATRAK